MIDNKADEVIGETFESLPFRYQIGLESYIMGSDFFLNYVDLLFQKYHKTNLKPCGSLQVLLFR